MSVLKPPPHLPELVKRAFTKALQEAELHYFETKVTVLRVSSIPFQLRFSPALANKPKGPPPSHSNSDSSQSQSQNKPPFDPFANPPASLYLTPLGASHFLVLNKFAVVPEHFILATKEFKAQTDVLDVADLEATAACIKAYDEQGEESRNREKGAQKNGLYAFFNCGEHSGASQPHRHVQLLPTDRMRDGLTAEMNAWHVLADSLDNNNNNDNNRKSGNLPFLAFSESIQLDTMSGQDLFDAYIRLYRDACRSVAVYSRGRGGQIPDDGEGDEAEEGEIPSRGPSRISYNMAMTKSRLVICPRLKEGIEIKDGNGDVVGSCAMNGTVLAGTALVKSQAEWDALKDRPEEVLRVLKAVGIPAGEESGKL